MVKLIKQYLKRKGLFVQSYRPGRNRLYRIVSMTNDGSIVKTFGQYMTAKELKAWFEGFKVGERW